MQNEYTTLPPYSVLSDFYLSHDGVGGFHLTDPSYCWHSWYIWFPMETARTFHCCIWKKVIVSWHVRDSGLEGDRKHPCVLILSQYFMNDSGPEEKNLSSEIEYRSLSGLAQQGASYYISPIPGLRGSLAWKRGSVCSYEENRKTHFSVAWHWTGSFSQEDILARGKCSLRKAPAGSSNLSRAIHEILSDSLPSPGVAGDWVRGALEPVFSGWGFGIPGLPTLHNR